MAFPMMVGTPMNDRNAASHSHAKLMGRCRGIYHAFDGI